MTLRAYRPLDDNQPQNEALDWQDTLLERRPSPRQNYNASAPRSRALLLTGLFALAAILVTGYFVLKGRSNGDSIPLVAADTTAYKARPDSPGGAEIPFQDKLVFNRLDPNGQPVQAEKLLPPPEEPMPSKSATALTTEETTAAPTASATAKVEAPPAVTVTPLNTVAPAPIAAPAMPVTAAPVAAPPTPVAVAPIHSIPAPAATNPKTGTAATTSVTPTAIKPAPTVKPTTATTTPAAAGTARIQLASIPDQANAQKALTTLTAKYGSTLGSARLSLVKADIAGKGTYWRVQSQPIDRGAASSVCSAITAQGGTCILAH